MEDKPSASSCVHAVINVGSMTSDVFSGHHQCHTHGLWKSKAPAQEQPECLLGHAGPYVSARLK